MHCENPGVINATSLALISSIPLGLPSHNPIDVVLSLMLLIVATAVFTSLFYTLRPSAPVSCLPFLSKLNTMLSIFRVHVVSGSNLSPILLSLLRCSLLLPLPLLCISTFPIALTTLFR